MTKNVPDDLIERALDYILHKSEFSQFGPHTLATEIKKAMKPKTYFHPLFKIEVEGEEPLKEGELIDGEYYFYTIVDCLGLYELVFRNDETDKRIIKLGLGFRTKKGAQALRDAIKREVRL